jgi:hypothetical protein
MKIKIITILASIAAILLVLANCGPSPDSLDDSLSKRLKGNTYVLGNVKNSDNGIDVTSEFTGLRLAFSADATSLTITSPAKPCLNGTYSSQIGGLFIFGSVTLTSPPPCAPFGMSMARILPGDSSFEFNWTLPSTSIVIQPGRTSSENRQHTFNLVKQ